MTGLTPYQQLIEYTAKTQALSQAAGLLGWDQETMMPKAGAPARAEQQAALAEIVHQRQSNPMVGEWLQKIDPLSLDKVGQANLRLIRRDFEHSTKIPETLSSHLAKKTALAQGIWANARAEEDVQAFLPELEEIIALKCEEAQCLAVQGQTPYDALLDQFEPGAKSSDLIPVFERLRQALVGLRESINDKFLSASPLNGSYPADQQLAMARKLAEVFNYDFNAGRIDRSVHPFSSGYRSDSRITTRTDENNVTDCLYSTVHEVGHANYEQGRDPAMDRTPAGGYASMGIHESQSRMLENQIGRSRAFMEWLLPKMREVFGHDVADNAEALFFAVNKVTPGFIRTEADEVHYNLHVLLRFELEIALIGGDLHVRDLEATWNDTFKSYFDQAVDKPSNGILQDVHWSGGMFGYFPTYTLGNIYAAEQFKIMGAAIPDMENMIRQGQLDAISTWLGSNIHIKGNVLSASQLMMEICGKTPDEQALVDYLSAKFC